MLDDIKILGELVALLLCIGFILWRVWRVIAKQRELIRRGTEIKSSHPAPFRTFDRKK